MSGPRERSTSRTARRRVPPVSSDLSTELATCIARIKEAGRPDLLVELLGGLREIIHHPAPVEQPSREDPDGYA